MNEDDFTHDLLEGWAEANLQDLIGLDGVLTDGDWIETKDQDPQGNVRLIQLADIGDGFYRNRSQRFLTSETAQRLNCTFLKPGDVLVARMPEPLGRACIFPGDEKPAVTAVDVCIIRTGSPGVDHSWLVGVVNSPKMREEFERLQKGITRKRISKKNLISVKFPVPPYPEQRRIGAKIEELLDSVQKATNHLERVPAILENFRKAVLNAACFGRLTEDWREKHPDVEPASKLTERIRQHRINDFKQACEEAKAEGRRKPKKPKFLDVPVFEVGDENMPEEWVYVSGAALFSWSSGKFLPRKKQEIGDYPVYGGNGISGHHNEYLVAQPTLVIGRVGAHCGNVYFTEREVWITDNAIYASYVPTHSVLRYLYLVFKNSNLNARSGGSGQPFVNQTVLDELSIPFPPHAEQEEIVRRVDRLFALASNVRERYERVSRTVNRIPQTVLSKAFRGELVPTEAELARRQGRTYETAVQLLKRIKLERDKKRTLEVKVSEKIKARSKVMSAVRGPKKRPILEVLSESQGKLKPEQLFQKAGFTEEYVDDFYEELREAVQAGQIKELRPNKKEIYLEAIKP